MDPPQEPCDVCDEPQPKRRCLPTDNDTLHKAVRADDIQQLERALSEGATIDSTSVAEAEDGFELDEYPGGAVTALMLAIRLGRNHIARLLLERGADVHARASSGATPLYVSADVGDVEMIQALVAVGGDVHATENDGATPILTGEGERDLQAPPASLPATYYS